jgi:hypothetical protein
MQNWLQDNSALLIIVLSIAALLFGYGWFTTRRRYYALGAGTAVVLLGLICVLRFLLPLLFGETDAQQIKRKIEDMAAGVKAHNVQQIFRNISEEFRFGSHDKASFRRRAEEVLRSREVDEVIFWEFESGEISREKRTAKVSFMVKARGNWRGSEAGYPCEADFVLDPDGQWRMKGFQLFKPFVDSKEPMPIPGL